MQLSIIGQRRTAELLDSLGIARESPIRVLEFHELFHDKGEQIARVEQNSDAYHLKVGDRDVLVPNLIEVTRKGAESQSQ